MTRTRNFAVVIALLLASACSALNADNPAGTLQAQREGYVAEATSIAQAAQAQGTQVMSTAMAAQTYIAQMEARNQQLLATLRAALPPTQSIINNSGPVTPGSLATPAAGGEVMAAPTLPASSGSSSSLGSMQFTQIGTAASVRSSDDCAESLTSSFPADVQTIYITTRALNVKAGTTMRVEWSYAGQLTSSETWTVPRDDSDFCLWLSLQPQGAAFSTGNWSVSLFANDQPLDPAVINFTIGSTG